MKIAFIAMSGVRVQDQQLLDYGLTLPGFVERSKVIASLPSLGLLTLAALTPPPHTCSYIEVADLKQLPELPGDFDLVAISSYTAQIHEAYQLADRFRERRIPVVLGGLHVTALPDEAAQHADAVVIGEGEPVWPQVLRDAERGKLKPRYTSPGDYDLSLSPIPAYELLDIEKYNRLTVQTSRGCPFQCAFCASSILLSPRYKQKAAERVLAEIDHICTIWKRPFIEFADDNSFVNKRYWKSLLPQLAERKLHWFAETDLSIHEDPELLQLMRDAGCAHVLIGFESPTLPGLDHIEMKNNFKAKHVSRYMQAVHDIQSRGIRVTACFVLGLDGQTPEVFDEISNFAEQARLFDVQITLLTPFPGTPLYRRLQKEDRLLDPAPWDASTLFDLNFIPTPMSADELHNGFLNLARRLYSHDASEKRKALFNDTYLRHARHVN